MISNLIFLKHGEKRLTKMLKKLGEKYSKFGLFGLIGLILNKLLSECFGIRVVKDKSVKQNFLAKKFFGNCVLKDSGLGYCYLSPMPSEIELDKYYESIYWRSRNGKKYGVNARDLLHYTVLKDKIPNQLSSGKKILNFGAGHGGVSHLCWLDGLDVVNVEPSGMPQFYETRWKSYTSIFDVPDCDFDLIYGSHSLEHVPDITTIQNEIKRILRPSGFLFWEVPNSAHPENGPKEGKVIIPHTYYFYTSFFDNWFDRVIINGGFDQCSRNGVIEMWQNYSNKKGEVIRALGQIK